MQDWFVATVFPFFSFLYAASNLVPLSSPVRGWLNTARIQSLCLSIALFEVLKYTGEDLIQANSIQLPSCMCLME